MDSEFEKQIEREIDRQLKELPDLIAPPTLISRVMREIAARAQLPWYRQAWQSWPWTLQVVSMFALLALFAGVSVGCWELTQSAGAAELRSHFHGAWFTATSLWSTLNVLLGALLLSVKQLGTGFILGCLAAVALAYATCIGLGAAYFRLAITGRR
jgi:hypothetical protein